VGWGGGCRVEHAFACGWGWVLVPGNQGSPAAPPGEPAGGGVWPRGGRWSGERGAVGFHGMLDPPLGVGDGQVVRPSGGGWGGGGVGLEDGQGPSGCPCRTSQSSPCRSVCPRLPSRISRPPSVARPARMRDGTPQRLRPWLPGATSVAWGAPGPSRPAWRTAPLAGPGSRHPLENRPCTLSLRCPLTTR